MQERIPLFNEGRQIQTNEKSQKIPTSKRSIANLPLVSLAWIIFASIMVSVTWFRIHDLARSIEISGYFIVIFGAMFMIFGTYDPVIWRGYRKKSMEVGGSRMKVLFSGIKYPMLGIILGFVMIIFS